MVRHPFLRVVSAFHEKMSLNETSHYLLSLSRKIKAAYRPMRSDRLLKAAVDGRSQLQGLRQLPGGGVVIYRIHYLGGIFYQSKIQPEPDSDPKYFKFCVVSLKKELMKFNYYNTI